jgi:hypothetical protein
LKHFLVVYNRRTGRIERSQEYDVTADALEARFASERDHHGQPDIEIVVLGGESWAALQRTHSRYFSRVQDLAKTGLERIAFASQ